MMRPPFWALVVCLVLATGCSQQSSESSRPQAAVAAAGPVVGNSLAARPSIASLPDTGDLLRYDPVRQPRRGASQTSYPVALSESHAYRALADGEMVVRAPDGELLRLKPERHEEHADGNWTLIARDAEGTQALLTFGQDAVFGSINRADGSTLEITTQQRQVYLVARTREQFALHQNPGAARGGDVLLPPVLQAAAERQVGASGSSATQAQVQAAALGPNDVDVLLGYSNGLVARIGSVSGTVTRMQNLVAIANEAYQNSGVTMRLRLVRTLLVNYTDDTTNQDALQKMTGSTGSGAISVDPAFNALRAAREESGADLVAFIRQFREPEQDGCGIAWLLGGGQTAITASDARFGYSVSSDGSDVGTDGRTYFCRDETFAHETGHNFGQAHNRDNAEGSGGAHVYSYGYRETSPTGFFTVMAYRIPDSSQAGIRYFANPAVSFQGRATGVANDSDNVRSMNQTMPIIAGFYQGGSGGALAGVDTDMNGDGRSDIVWRNTVTQQTSRWFMNGPSVIGGQADSQSAAWRIVGIGDFDGDGRSDLLWSSGTALVMWRPNASNQYVGSFVANVPSGEWSVAGVGDMNGDGRADIVWRNPATQQTSRWYMNGAAVIGGQADSQSAAWRIVGIGDFDADGRSDLLWSSGSALVMWRPNASNQYIGSFVASIPDGEWSVAGVADMNGDGRADIVWRNPATQQTSRWYMNGPAVIGGQADFQSAAWRIVAIGDYDGDSRSDLLWANNSTLIMWRPNANNVYVGSVVASLPGGEWTIVSGNW